MQETKPWYLSKGVLGSLGTILISILGFFNIDITPENMQLLIADGAVLVTGILSLIGRIKAIFKISL